MKLIWTLALLTAVRGVDDPKDVPDLLLKLDDGDGDVRKDAFDRLAAIPEARERLKKAVAAEGATWLKKAAAERSRTLKALFAASRKAFNPAALEAKRKELLDLLAAGNTKAMEPKVRALWTEFYFDVYDVELDEKFAAAKARLRDVIAWQKRLETPDKESIAKQTSELFRTLDESTLLQVVPPKDQKIMVENMAMRGEVPDLEFRHAQQVNLYRLLLGKGALKLNPKLCDAAREHCADMIQHKFFAHESPLPGKRTPGDRAKNHGASAGGENIYLGSENPDDAFWAWFNSLGHHKNMVGDYTVFGVGNSARHWTQMFG
ncbi:MAG TPA: CAP domain-containing protein [Planctomycetota bacterium]